MSATPEPVRTGIVGLGRSGWNIHVKNLKERENYVLTAVADAEAERRREAAEELGCATFTDAAELFASGEAELVIIATPSHTHAPLGIQALEAGLHVLLEKPMATSTAEADRLIAAARKAERVLSVYHSRRFDRTFRKIQELIAGGILGEIALVRIVHHTFRRRSDWQTLQKFGGGILNNWGAHVVDMGLQLVGEGELDLFADMRLTVSAGDADDHAKLVFRRADGTGPVVDIELSHICAYPQDTWRVLGSRGTVRGGFSGIEWQWYPEGVLPELAADEGPAAGRSYGRAEEIPWREESFAESGLEIDLIYDGLVQSIRQGGPPPVTPESARRLMYVLDRCREAAGWPPAD